MLFIFALIVATYQVQDMYACIHPDNTFSPLDNQDHMYSHPTRT